MERVKICWTRSGSLNRAETEWESVRDSFPLHLPTGSWFRSSCSNMNCCPHHSDRVGSAVIKSSLRRKWTAKSRRCCRGQQLKLDRCSSLFMALNPLISFFSVDLKSYPLVREYSYFVQLVLTRRDLWFNDPMVLSSSPCRMQETLINMSRCEAEHFGRHSWSTIFIAS